jgi:hypothetical protein
MITVLLAAAALAIAMPTGARAQTHWVAKNGNDSDTCTEKEAPCLTVQGAIRKVQQGTYATISIAPGVYEEQISIVYFRGISLVGDCQNIGAVTLRGPQPGPVIWVEDHPIAVVACLTLDAAPGVSGVAGIVSRQFSITDYTHTRFGDMPGGTHIVANEMSKINCQMGNEIAGSAVSHVSVGGMSTILLGRPINVVVPVSFDQFASVGWQSYLDASIAAFQGAAVTGKKYIVQHGVLLQPPGGMPGSQPGEVYDGGLVK